MKSDNYKKVKSYLHPGLLLPQDFFSPPPDGSAHCIFMLSCLGQDKLLYLDESFQSLSGYPSQKLLEGGMDFWFSLIHPDDREQISEKIIASHQLLASQGFNEKEPPPLILTYRVKHASGEWTWIKDTKFLVSFSEKVIDKVLGKFEIILPESISDEDLKKKLDEEESCTKLLEFALLHQHDGKKQSLHSPASNNEANPSRPPLTKREKEILQLIAEGLSTKMIAGRCNISIHTVETHRRHLLEKLQVKNSVELIKEASKIYWL